MEECRTLVAKKMKGTDSSCWNLRHSDILGKIVTTDAQVQLT